MQAIPSDILEKLGKLPKGEREDLLRAGVYEAARARVRQLQQDVFEAERHIHRFEHKYSVTFEQFEGTLMAELDSLEAHEDYTDWFFWVSVLQEKQKTLDES